MARITGWSGAAAVAVGALLLLTWQHRQADEARRRLMVSKSGPSEPGPALLAEPEASVRGVAVPGSLQWRMYGDEIGMGLCEAQFLLARDGAARPIRVRWTRCDMPDELSDELRRLASPVRGAPALSVSARGHWARESEFEALSLRLQP